MCRETRRSRRERMGLRYSGSMCARQRGRLSLVGGGMKERFRLPRLSNRRGCRSQIKLSVSAFLSSSFLSSSIHSTISLPYIFSFLCSSLHFCCSPSFPPSFVSLHLNLHVARTLLLCICSYTSLCPDLALDQSHAHSLQP